MQAVQADLCRGRVLIVDDYTEIANLLAESLQLFGYVTEVAYDAFSALERAEQFRPEVALLDIGLPDMSGYELATRMKLSPSLANTQLVALTGRGSLGDRQRSQAAGFSMHLVKPVDLHSLDAALLAAGRVRVWG